MKEVTMTFDKEELELLYEIVSDRVDSAKEPDDSFYKINKMFNLGLKLKNEVDKLHPRCKLYNICDSKTGVCLAMLPDDGCPYYRYFKELDLIKGE